MKVDQAEVTTAIEVARAAAAQDDAAAAATVSLARRAGPDAVRFLLHIVRAEGASIFQRTRAACAILEVGGHLGGSSSSETTAAFRGPPEGNGVPERTET
jgi:hypothetical protein